MRTALFLVICVAACSPYDPTLPSAPFLCGTGDPQCPDGYECRQNGSASVCVAPGASGACTMLSNGMLVSYNLTGEPGSQPSTAATTSAPGVTTIPISRATPLMAAPGTDSINASNWPTSAQLDPNSYYTFALTPPTGCTVDVTAVAIDVSSSSTGPSSASVATSADMFVATEMLSITAPSMPTVTVSHVSGMLEFRIYGFSAAATTGTMRVQNELTVTGRIQ